MKLSFFCWALVDLWIGLERLKANVIFVLGHLLNAGSECISGETNRTTLNLPSLSLEEK